MMWFIFFALSPCPVKEVWFSAVNTEYSRPLNKSKTASTNLCQYSQNENQQVSVVKQSNASKQTEPVLFSKRLFCVVHSINFEADYSKTFSGNSPPRYILYKRLKLDVA